MTNENFENLSLLSQISPWAFNTPLMIEPTRLDLIIACAMKDVSAKTIESLTSINVDGSYHEPKRMGPLSIVPVNGILIHRGPRRYYTSYKDVETMVTKAVQDDSEAVVMHMKTPGGLVSGNFDLVNFLVEAKKEKPIFALVDDMATSAGYAIASAADKIYTTQTGLTGSIGVIVRHMDFSSLYEKMGIKIETIKAGVRKDMFSPDRPMMEDERREAQEKISSVYDDFVSLVAQNRGISEEAIRNTEARLYAGPAGVQLGLADVVASANDAFIDISNYVKERRNSMSKANTALNADAAAKAPEAPGITETQLSQAVEAAKAEGIELGAQQERERINGILSLEEGAGKDSTVKQLAMTEGMTPDMAKGILATVPGVEQITATVDTGFAEHMNSLDNPDVEADSDVSKGDDNPALAVIEAGKQIGVCA